MDDGILSITNDADVFTEFLTLIASNPDLDVRTAAALMEQVSGATVLKTMEGWNKVGRRISKGEMGFRVHGGVTLFDILQTYGEPLSQQRQLKERTPRMQKALDALLDYAPVIATVNREQETAARYSPEKCVIEVNPKYGEHDVFKALCREICHAHFHLEYDLDYSRRLFAVDAEGAAFVAAQHFGVTCEKPSDISAHYYNVSLDARLASLNMIRDSATGLCKAVSAGAFPTKNIQNRRNLSNEHKRRCR